MVTKKRQELIDRLCSVLGKDFLEIRKSSCIGKWSGTYDYSVEFKDGTGTFICNGARDFDENLEKLVRACEMFMQKKADIYRVLEELQKKDAIVAKEKGLMTYTVENVFLDCRGTSIWAIVMLKLRNGQYFAMKETNLSHFLLHMLEENGLEKMCEHANHSYFVAGGLDGDADFVHHNVGFSSKKDLYNAFEKIPVTLTGKSSGASHYGDQSDASAFYFELGDEEEKFFLKDHVRCNNCGSYKMSRDVLADAVLLGLISDRSWGIWESDLHQMYENVQLN